MSNAAFEEKYLIGLDFGTLSARAVVVRASDGAVISDAVEEYPHGVMDRTLTAGDGQVLPADYALQVASDYLFSMDQVVPAALSRAGIDARQVVGIGLDGTSATVIVTDREGTPLSEKEEFVNEPHAYVKLWKHHGAQEQAERIVRLAKDQNMSWLGRYGGTLSSEMLLPKALETLEKAPNVYEATSEIVNLVDWLTWKLTGTLSYAAGDSGYKRMYQDGDYPSEDFLAALNPAFATVYSEKMSHPVIPLGEKVGGLNADYARKLGLPEGIAVASGNIDAHVQAASVNAVKPGELTGILGTSSCWVVPSLKYSDVPGIFGVVDGGIVDGAWGYEAGQSAVGDIFAWFIENCVPESYIDAAEQRGVSIHEYLADKAAQLTIGESGLVALDWWNGNRSTLVDANLTGLMIGMSLTTTPEEQYRALLEATAFGARTIIENFEKHGVQITSIHAAGGLLKNSLLMQIYADVTRRAISVATVDQAGAQGSAIFAAVAAGLYPDVSVAAGAMGGVIENAYVPNEEAAAEYDPLYRIYSYLYDLFGKENRVMHELKDIRRHALLRKAAEPKD